MFVTACVASPAPDDPIPPEPADPAPTDPSDPEPPEISLLRSWMQCMELSDFQASNMAGAWANTITSNNTRCSACHENGADGFIATLDEQRFFDVLKGNKYFALMFFTVYGPADHVVVNDVTIPSISRGEVPHTQHPLFDASLGLAATSKFYDLTQARFLAGTCAP